MGEKTGITWANATWNPWQGCHKISEGCENCYMHREKKRYGQDPNVVVRSKPHTFNAPLRWKEPKRIFTCSWSDFFIKEADIWRGEAMEIIEKTPQHTYLILTKRLKVLPADVWWPNNVWIGVTVESQGYADRILELYWAHTRVKFVSCEPLLGPIDLQPYIGGLNWVITGGESGPGARPMNPIWAIDIQRTCKASGVPFFHKQNGGTIKGHGAVVGGDELDGRIYHEFPSKGGS